MASGVRDMLAAAIAELGEDQVLPTDVRLSRAARARWPDASRRPVRPPGIAGSRLVPPPMRTSLPFAASVARFSAAWMPSVTKWKVVPPSMVIDARGCFVRTKTGQW